MRDRAVAGTGTDALEREIAWMTGVGPDGSAAAASYYGSYEGAQPFKWGSSTPGTAAVIAYAFAAEANFSDREKATLTEAMAMWSAVAAIGFRPADPLGAGRVDLVFRRDPGGAYTEVGATRAAGAALGTPDGPATVSIDTGVPGFDLSGSLSLYGGYGLATAVHELGHVIGLGHAGAYDGTVDPMTQQFGPYDDRLWTTMSYIGWINGNTPFRSATEARAADWGVARDGTPRQVPHSAMQVDILAAQRLYGAPAVTPFGGGQVYGFNTTITGPLHDIFDFRVNRAPVVTLFSTGRNNTLDLSGYGVAQTVDLADGAVSDVGGMHRNLVIATGTVIEHAVGGWGADTISGNAWANRLSGGNGDDLLRGLDGDDTLLGGGGDDTLLGGIGADRLEGGTGADMLDGGIGADALLGGAGEDTLLGGADADRLEGGPDADALDGGTGDDELIGGAGADRLSGGDGADRLSGGEGDDVLSGGTGTDVLVGNGGADRFVFDDLSAMPDRVLDFSHAAGDRIDLSLLDARPATTADDAFRWIGSAAFSGAPGELRWSMTEGAVLLSADVNGDRVADLIIRLDKVDALVLADIVL